MAARCSIQLKEGHPPSWGNGVRGGSKGCRGCLGQQYLTLKIAHRNSGLWTKKRAPCGALGRCFAPLPGREVFWETARPRINLSAATASKMQSSCQAPVRRRTNPRGPENRAEIQGVDTLSESDNRPPRYTDPPQ